MKFIPGRDKRILARQGFAPANHRGMQSPSPWKMFPRFLASLVLFILSLGLEAAPLESSPFGPVVASVSPAASVESRSAGNQVSILSNGYDALLLRIHLIRQARTSITVQTFIWTNDECGRLMIFELLEAARRGVKVRIIADHLFSDQNADTVAFLATAHPNLEIKHYRPARSRIKQSFLRTLQQGLFSFHALNQRMHSKVMVIDGAVLITGGRNIENTYYDHSTTLNFRDRDLLVIGPAVLTAREQFELFWNYPQCIASKDLIDVRAVIKKGAFKRYEQRSDYDFGPHFVELTREAEDAALIRRRFVDALRPVAKATFIYDAPGKARGAGNKTAQITRDLVATLEKARDSVVIQTPYLVLSPTARQLVRELQDRNPKLQFRISTNSFASTDNAFAYSANYRLRNLYVQALRLEVHELKPAPQCMEMLFPRHAAMRELANQGRAASAKPRVPIFSLHAKSLVIDDSIAFVGSYNLDPRSEALNTEVGVLVEDRDFVVQLRREIETDMLPENSWVIARNRLPLKLNLVNGLVDGIISLTPLDVWPIQNTSSFELRPGAIPVSPSHPDFHDAYEDVGSFPGTDGLLSKKEILTRLYKAVGAPLTPIL